MFRTARRVATDRVPRWARMRGTGRCPVTAIAARAQGDSLCAIAGIAAGLTKSVPVPSVPSVPLSAGGVG